MSEESLREVYKQLRTAQDKYSYFILAAAGAAIAFAVNQTQGATLNYSQIPLALAVVSWGLSFYFGCNQLAYVSSTLYANAELLKIESGIHSQVGTNPQLMAIASEGIREAIEHSSTRANRLAHMQFRFLITGAILYIIWHVLEMYLRLTH